MAGIGVVINQNGGWERRRGGVAKVAEEITEM